MATARGPHYNRPAYDDESKLYSDEYQYLIIEQYNILTCENSGQSCVATGRLFEHVQIHPQGVVASSARVPSLSELRHRYSPTMPEGALSRSIG